MKKIGLWILVLAGMNASCVDSSSRVEIPTLERIIEQTDQSKDAGRHIAERALDDAIWLIGGRREAAIAARIPRHDTLHAIVEWRGGLNSDHQICIITEKHVNYFCFNRSSHRVTDEKSVPLSVDMMARFKQAFQQIEGYRGGEDMVGVKDASLVYVACYSSGRLSTQFVTECEGRLPFFVGVHSKMTTAWYWVYALHGDLVRLIHASVNQHTVNAP